MKKQLLLILLASSIVYAGNGSVAGIKFGDDLSAFSKFNLNCEKLNTGNMGCILPNQTMINDSRIERINFYFNNKNKLYLVGFFGKQLQVSKYADSSDIEKAESTLQEVESFLSALTVKEKKLVNSGGASSKMVKESFTDSWYQSHIFYSNIKMMAEVDKEENSAQENKMENIKANY